MKHDKSADGLRGLAALNVVLCHFVSAFMPTALHGVYTYFPENPSPSLIGRCMQSPVLTVFYNGQFAVLIFFVLSGYVLTLPYYVGEMETLKRRFWSRFLRLYIPIAISVAISYSLFSSGHFYSLPASELSGSNWLRDAIAADIPFRYALKNFLYSAVFDGSLLNPPLWSLRIEFLGSLLLLAYYLVKPRGKDSWTFAISAFFLYAVSPRDSIYFVSILAGSFLSQIKLKPNMRVVCGLLGLFFGAYSYQTHLYQILPSPPFWEPKTFFNAIGAVLLVSAVIHGFGRKHLEKSPIQFIGKISYSLYLLHYLILCSLISYWYTKWPQSRGIHFMLFALYLAVAFLSATIYERVVDRPATILSRRFGSWLFEQLQSPKDKNTASANNSLKAPV